MFRNSLGMLRILVKYWYQHDLTSSGLFVGLPFCLILLMICLVSVQHVCYEVFSYSCTLFVHLSLPTLLLEQSFLSILPLPFQLHFDYSLMTTKLILTLYGITFDHLIVHLVLAFISGWRDLLLSKNQSG